jgi:xylulokinase
LLVRHMSRKRLALGLDLSTQSLTAVAIDIDARKKIVAYSLDYAKDKRLNGFGLRSTDYILPPRTEGEADQPPEMFLAALDAIFTDLSKEIPLGDTVVINTSGQQHGHVYLGSSASSVFRSLQEKGSEKSTLAVLLKDSLSYQRAPIWMTSNTAPQAEFIKNTVGGMERLIKLSGSDAQLRFTGIVIRRIAEQFPEIYARTGIIQLIGNFVPAVLTGNALVPADFGNACGMSLMNYRRKQWSDTLLHAASQGLPGSKKAFRAKLPVIGVPDAIVGTIAAYFVHKYGFSSTCLIAAGSGDNPQSKVLISGDLLSLGSSFVNMVATDGKILDMSGASCAMYDGIGRPFLFGCRTNGALVWDQVRALYGMAKEEYGPAEAALQQVPPGQNLVFWQPRNESFPLSGKFDLERTGDASPSLGNDYAGIIESSLAAVFHHSLNFSAASGAPLYVMGGAVSSPGIMRRVAAIWKRPIVATDKGGAALGAAVAGVSAYFKSENEKFNVEEISGAVLTRGHTITPVPEDMKTFHRAGGYLDRFAAAEGSLLKKHPVV